MEEGVPCKTPAAKLTPPVKKSQDMHDERSKLVNEYACRVLELLGMGHRLFVPRLLAVRSHFLEINPLQICHLPSQSCLTPPGFLTLSGDVWGLFFLFLSASHNPSPKHWVFIFHISSEGLDTSPASGDWCHSLTGLKGSQPGLQCKKKKKIFPKAMNAFVLSPVMIPDKQHARSTSRYWWEVL